MSKILKFIAVPVFFLLLFISPAEASNISAPTILDVDKESPLLVKPLIKGLTQAGTEVDIYIDNVYQGAATVNHENGKTDNFYFQPKLDLSDGVHLITAVAWLEDFSSNSRHSVIYTYEQAPLSAPTLLIPDEDDIVSKVKPRIIGLSKTATFVHLYIDGVYNGKTEVLSHESGTANFSYKPFLNLSRDRHIVWAVAEDSSGRKSRISNILKFKVEAPSASPLLHSPVVNNHSKQNQPFVVGLVKNNHKVQIFIDHKLNGEISPQPHVSGTANFSYKPFLELKPGVHVIYSVAYDERGKESLWSNIIYYNVPDPRITKEAAEEISVKSIRYSQEKQEEDVVKNERGDVIDEISKIQNKVSTSSLRNSGQGETVDIDDIINADDGGGATVSGAVNENEERQNSIKTNIVLFSFFLIAVIGWIFWVNQELIKEKQKGVKKEDKK